MKIHSTLPLDERIRAIYQKYGIAYDDGTAHESVDEHRAKKAAPIDLPRISGPPINSRAWHLHQAAELEQSIGAIENADRAARRRRLVELHRELAALLRR